MKVFAVMLLPEEVFVPFDSSRRTYDRVRLLKWPFSAILVLTQSNFPMSWGLEIWHTHSGYEHEILGSHARTQGGFLCQI